MTDARILTRPKTAKLFDETLVGALAELVRPRAALQRCGEGWGFVASIASSHVQRNRVFPWSVVWSKHRFGRSVATTRPSIHSLPHVEPSCGLPRPHSLAMTDASTSTCSNLPPPPLAVATSGSHAYHPQGKPEGFDIVLDAVLGPMFNPGWARVARGGRYIVYGAASMTPTGSLGSFNLWNWLTLAWQCVPSRPISHPTAVVSNSVATPLASALPHHMLNRRDSLASCVGLTFGLCWYLS
jgi:hypothetical protein